VTSITKPRNGDVVVDETGVARVVNTGNNSGRGPSDSARYAEPSDKGPKAVNVTPL
jgi:hypothetical protein